MLTADQFRDLALSMEGAVEHAHMGHPDFRAANGRIFATLHTSDTLGMVILTPEEQQAVMREDPRMFVPSSGTWGRQGCTNVVLNVATKGAVRGAILLAWQTISSRPPSRSSRSRTASIRPQRSRRKSS